MEAFLSSLLEAHPVLAPLVFIFLRAIPVIVPPIPGVAFDLVGVAMFGWKWGLVLALMGGHLGGIISFFIARYLREPAAAYFVPLRKLHELEERYSERQKFWALVGMRFVTSPVFDYVNYAAGLTKISFPMFILTSFIGVLPYSFVIYYFGDLTLEASPLFALMFFSGIAILAMFLGKAVLKKVW